jgi:maleamate amidohydrolase
MPSDTASPLGRPWDIFLTEVDRAVLSKGRFGRRMGFGRRAAVLVIDAQRYMVGRRAMTLPGHPAAGPSAAHRWPPPRRVVRAAQDAGAPCIFTALRARP